MKTIIGDITNAEEKIIIHQVNCMNVMGSGVAKALYTKWPQVKREYHEYCDRMFKMGFSNEQLLGNIAEVYVGNDKYVINCFSQLTYGNNGKQHTDYEAIKLCFANLISLFRTNDLLDASVAIPYYYGCGLGGGTGI